MLPDFARKPNPPRAGHRTVGNGFSGYAYFAALRAAADRAGIECQTHSRATSLVLDRSGAVLGVQILRLDDATARMSIKGFTPRFIR